MKYLLLLLLLPLAGCEKKLPDGTIQAIDDSWGRVTYQGHVYIRWEGCHMGGIAHDPDCKYCKPEKTK